MQPVAVLELVFHRILDLKTGLNFYSALYFIIQMKHSIPASGQLVF
jgi:hypothetical protein